MGGLGTCSQGAAGGDAALSWGEIRVGVTFFLAPPAPCSPTPGTPRDTWVCPQTTLLLCSATSEPAPHCFPMPGDRAQRHSQPHRPHATPLSSLAPLPGHVACCCPQGAR